MASREEQILQQVKRVRSRKGRRAMPEVEDYLEVIYALEKVRGFATSKDVARHLNVRPSAVTKMLRRLRQLGYIDYEQYRGFVLTETGREVAADVLRRHEVLVRFLEKLGVPPETAEEEAEFIEHGLSSSTLEILSALIDFLESRPDVTDELIRTIEERVRHRAPANPVR
jgi:Mn-dependent DtxR family transcriptional regulator